MTSINTAGTENDIVFSGGTVSLFLDSTPDADLAATTGFTDSDTGSPWLTLQGFPTETTTGPNAGETGTLFGVGSNFADAENIAGTGIGLLQITGGCRGKLFRHRESHNIQQQLPTLDRDLYAADQRHGRASDNAGTSPIPVPLLSAFQSRPPWLCSASACLGWGASAGCVNRALLRPDSRGLTALNRVQFEKHGF